MHNIENLIIWKKAITLVKEVYKVCNDFPQEEKYGLTSQIKRSSVSIPSNIAEGAGRNTTGQFCNFLRIANGSLYELHTQLILANELEFLKDEHLEKLLKLIEEIRKINFSLQKSLDQSNSVSEPIEDYLISKN